MTLAETQRSQRGNGSHVLSYIKHCSQGDWPFGPSGWASVIVLSQQARVL